MELETRDEIQQRIELLAKEEPGGVVACDGDGTLWSGDVGDDLFYALLERGPVLAPAHERMVLEAKEHGLDAAGTALDVVRRIHDAYLAHAFPEERMYEMVAWAFAGWTRADVACFARDALERAGLVARLHHEVTETIEICRRRGVEVFVVSASPRAVVEDAARRIGIDEGHVLAATPTFREDTMLADVERPIPYGDGKVAALRRAIGGRTLYAAFGDNAFDVAMLREARVPVAVRPKDRLRARAHEVPGLVEIARA